MYAKNDQYTTTYVEKELTYFTQSRIDSVQKFQQTHHAYEKTPLHTLQNLAAHLGVNEIKVKDESYRFGLNAFKVLGGIYAIGKYMATQLGEEIENVTFVYLQSHEVREKLGALTFISATDGNHGKGVAWAARELGQKAVIYLPQGSAKTRLKAVQLEGAEAAITKMNYDDTVKMCAGLADENGWIMVQDTAWEGYDDIPLWIMQGYATIASEIIEELERLNEQPPTHIFLQAGVGSFAAGIAAYFKTYYRKKAPTVIVLEPHLANCYYRSFKSKTKEAVTVTGHMNSIMAGLCCGEPNRRAFRILSYYADGCFSLDDEIAALGMRVLGNPLGDDPKIISGESGAAVGIGLLQQLHEKELTQLKKATGINEGSRILFINTEGDTDKAHYLDVVWKGLHPLT